MLSFWKDLHDSNNLCHSNANASGLSNVSDNFLPVFSCFKLHTSILPEASDTNVSFEGESRDEVVNQNNNSWTNESKKSINRNHTNPVSSLATTCNINDKCYSYVSQKFFINLKALILMSFARIRTMLRVVTFELA